MTSLLSRKFLFAVVADLMGFILTLQGKATAEQWMAFTAALGVTYILGNVASKKLTK